MNLDPIDVLIVDDEPEIGAVMVSIAEAAGYTAFATENAKESLNVIEFSSPSLVITDISMPNMSGLEMLKEIRGRGISLGVVMMTAHSEQERILQALQLGALDYVVKPFDTDKLIEKIPLWIEVGRRMRDLSKAEGVQQGDLIQAQIKMIELFRRKSVTDFEKK